jgi:NAD+ kinase
MRITVVGKVKKDVDKLRKQISVYGYKVAKKGADAVISFGGDGSFLIAERHFPSVPKLIIRDKSICKKCNAGKLKAILNKLVNRQFTIKKYHKMEAEIKRKDKLTRKKAVNDIVVRNKEPYHALRFILAVNNRGIDREFIGDGIVVATPFGSTGYFYSITGKSFKKGVGIAFNNVTIKTNPLVLKNPVVRLKVIRNKAVVCSDNDMDTITIGEGDVVEVRESREMFQIIETIGNHKNKV